MTEELKGRRICSHCKKDMGPAKTKADSHGGCKPCIVTAFDMTSEEYDEMMAEDLMETGRSADID